MGRGRQGTGVEARAESIRIRFTYLGARRYETLDLKPTPANLKYAERLVSQIRRDIAAGAFNYAELFPNSGQRATTRKFDEFAREWLKTKVVEASTLECYRPHISWWCRMLGDKRLDQITPMQIQHAIATRAKTVSAKTVNNTLIPLRGVFAAAAEEGLVTRDPTKGVRNLKVQKASPDPFSRDEMEKMLAYMEARYPEPVWGWYAFAFLTGLRPSEQVALRWGDIDWSRKQIVVRRAIVRGKEKGTKSNRERAVDISPRADAVLRRMRQHTLLRGDDQEVFCNPATGGRWKQDDLQGRLETYWYPVLKALGIRRRISYQTRHTFATQLLMAGINVAYIARQLGHKSAKVTLEHYARWVDGSDAVSEQVRAMEVWK